MGRGQQQATSANQEHLSSARLKTDYRRPLQASVGKPPLGDKEPAGKDNNGRWITSEGFMAQFPVEDQVPDMGHLACTRADHRSDHRVQAKLERALELLDAEGHDFDPELVAPIAELAEALSRAAARRHVHLQRCSASRIARNAVYLLSEQDPKTYTPPMLVLQDLYPKVSMSGWNLRFANEREYAEAVLAELPADHQERWQRIYQYRRQHRAEA